jgi:hypothetical protein
MRPTTPLLRRALAVAVLLSVGAACADVVTQPDGSAIARAPRFDLVDTTTLVAVDSIPTPHLLVCPTTDEASASAVIGPAGGTIGARGTTITIPAGAVADSTLFEVVVPVSQYMETRIHAVGVDHYEFARPATITINYARCPSGAVPATAALEGVYVDTSTYQILQQMGGVTDKTGHKVSFQTGHLSGYIIAY